MPTKIQAKYLLMVRENDGQSIRATSTRAEAIGLHLGQTSRMTGSDTFCIPADHWIDSGTASRKLAAIIRALPGTQIYVCTDNLLLAPVPEGEMENSGV